MHLYSRDIHAILDQFGLPDQDTPLLETILEAGRPLRVAEIASGTEGQLPFNTRQQYSRRLQKLAARGVVTAQRHGSYVHYAPDTRAIARAYLRTDHLKRETRGYQRQRLDAYQPNKTRWLPPATSADLRAVSDSVIRTGETINDTVFRRLLIDTAWASSSLEGNTYTIAETADLIDHGERPAGHTDAETQMIRNHAQTVEYLIQNAREIELNPHVIRGVHQLLSAGLLDAPGDEGRVRHRVVAIGHSAYAPTHDPHVLTEDLGKICDKARAIDDPYEESFFLLGSIPYLQPFADVNKRVGRMLANLPLLRYGLSPMTYFGIDRDEYIGGLIAWYEMDAPELLADSFEQGYRAAAQRYRTYFDHVSDRDSVEREHGEIIKRLARDYVRSVVRGKTDPEDIDRSLRLRMDDVHEGLDRDAVVVAARRKIRDLDQASAIGAGISPTDYDRFREAIGDRHSPGPTP